jgi:hypothetical protein
MSASAPEQPFAVARRGGGGGAERSGARGPASRGPRFTDEEILDALRRWTAQFGEPPRVIDLEPARARRKDQEWRADRFDAGRWPSAKMIAGRFGSLSAALAAAGVPGRRPPMRVAANLSGPEAVIAAIRAWVRRYGAVPTLADWDPARARRLGQDWRIARYHQGSWPSTRAVIARFGSMSAAISAAGLPPRGVGAHGRRHAGEDARAREAAARLESAGVAEEGTGLADALRTLSAARRRQDPVAMHSALIDVAGAALAWAELAGSGAG